jgi:hypothetical protein
VVYTTGNVLFVLTLPVAMSLLLQKGSAMTKGLYLINGRLSQHEKILAISLSKP